MSTEPIRGDSPSRHALGMPAGSVRALLAVGVLAYLWVLVLFADVGGSGPRASQSTEAFIYLQFLMVLILAHLFTAHGHSIGKRVSRRHPLGLPKGVVRVLLLAGYLGLAFYLYRLEPDFKVTQTVNVVFQLLLLLGAFFVGHAVTHVMRWLSGGTLPPWFLDIQAWFALLGLFLLGIVVIVRLVINTSLPMEGQIEPRMLEIGLTAVVSFYFGARS